VTGAAGMLGGAVVRRLQTAGAAVTALDRAACDLADATAVAECFAQHHPAAIVHCAAYTDVDGCERDRERAWRDNTRAAENVARAGAVLGAALIHLSTDYVFDGEKQAPYVEDDPPAPLNVYGKTKLEAEQAVRAHAPAHCIVRTSWVFGPGGRNFVRTMAELLRTRTEIRVVNDQTGSPTYTLDLAAALVEVTALGLRGTFHLTNAGSCTWYDFAVAIGSRLATAARIMPCTTAEFPRPARRPRNSVLDGRRAAAAGVAPLRSWRAALDDYLAGGMEAA
jgi:dTDP-4-dehydrorhamnose reductase